MKKSTFFIALVALFATAFNVNAQESPNSFLPKEGNFGASIVVDGLLDNIRLTTNESGYGQNILFFKYYLKDDLALRFGAGFDVDRVTNESSDSSGIFLIEVDSSRRTSSINVSFGIEKHLAPNKRLDPYFFGQMDLTLIGKTRTEVEARETSTIGTASGNREIVRDGGFAFGINAGGGLNYFLAKNFSVGSEFFLGFQYVSLGGGISDNITVTSATGNRSSVFSERESKTKTTDLQVSPTAQINISYFF